MDESKVDMKHSGAKEIVDYGNTEDTPETLSPVWSAGLTPHTPGTLAYLTSNGKRRFFYVVGHTGVVSDLKTGEQKFLRGHTSDITAMCLSKDRNIVVTAETGPDNIMVFWDTKSCTALKTIMSPFQEGVIDADMSADSRFVVALSKDRNPQAIAIWDREHTSSKPVVKIEFEKGHEFQHCVRFNQSNQLELLTNGKKKMVFWSWKGGRLVPHIPRKGISSIKAKVGWMTQSTFIPNSSKVTTITTSGNIVLWDNPIDVDEQTSDGRVAVKAIKVGSGSKLNLITVCGKHIIVGGDDGIVSFFDFHIKAIAWFEDIKAGGIHSISFAHGDLGHASSGAEAGEEGEEEAFSCPDFLVSTTRGKVVRMEASMFKKIHPEKRRGHKLIDGFDTPVSCVACHSSDPALFATGTTSGVFKLWNLKIRKAVHVHTFDGSNSSGGITAAAFHPDGKSMVLGVGNGRLVFLNFQKKDKTQNQQKNEEKEDSDNPRTPPLSEALEAGQIEVVIDREMGELSQPISRIVFSPCGNYIATSDLGRHVALFRWYHRDERKNKPIEWIYIGRHRAHTKAIASISFLPPTWGSSPSSSSSSSGVATGTLYESRVMADITPRLFSVGEDRLLHEFDVTSSSINRGLILKATTKTDESSSPTALLPLGGTDPRFACANNGYQIKLWGEQSRLKLPSFTNNSDSQDEKGGKDDDDNDEDDDDEDADDESTGEASKTISKDTLRCVKTTLAPTYGGPVSELIVIPSIGKDGKTLHDSQYLFYSTYSKMTGLLKLPLDGDPFKSSALIAHSGEISSCACTCDGRYVITGGSDDHVVTVWRVSVNALESSIILGGDPNQAFANVLGEGGQEGETFKEFKDFYYLCQLKQQGIDTREARKITNLIPPEQVVNLFRAMGYFPTESEICNLKQELASEAYPTGPDGIPQVCFKDAVRLYVNHRSVFGLKRGEIEEALQKLIHDDEEKAIKREDLLNIMKVYGEVMTPDEITTCLAALQGVRQKDVNSSQLIEALPAMMDADDVATELLGLVK